MASSTTLPMLVSLSIAASTSIEDGSADEEKPSSYVVKNTFIEISEPHSALRASRRSASAPPCRIESHESTLGEALLQRSLTKIQSWSNDLNSDASTSARGEAEDDGSSDELGSSDGSSPLVLADLLQAPLRQKLRASAATYTPGSTKTPVSMEWSFAPPQEPRVPQWVEHVTTACQAALRECKAVHHVQLREATNGLTIVGSVRAMHGLQAAKCSLAFAGGQMLSVTKQSKQVYMIGAGKNPFSPLPGGVGFTVQLAFVDDEDSACWNLIHAGCCSRGYHCRWQHPSWQFPVTVEIEFAT